MSKSTTDELVEVLKLLFAPTGSIQEVSISSGWGQEFLSLSARFDEVIKRV